MSEDRAERLRALLERIAPSAVRYRLSDRHDLAAELAARRTNPSGRPVARATAPDEAAAVAAFLENYYVRWLDEEIPALGGRTPRHAAGLKTQRPKVAALLREIKIRGNPGGGKLDLSRLWEALNLLDLR